MTDSEIKHNAEEYAWHKLDWSRMRHKESPYFAWKEAFEDGAHSRDEEVEKLMKRIAELEDEVAQLVNGDDY